MSQVCEECFAVVPEPHMTAHEEWHNVHASVVLQLQAEVRKLRRAVESLR